MTSLSDHFNLRPFEKRLAGRGGHCPVCSAQHVACGAISPDERRPAAAVEAQKKLGCWQAEIGP